MDQRDGAGADAGRVRSGEGTDGGGLVEGLGLDALDGHAAADLGDRFIQHGRQGDRQVEQARAGLVADAENVGKAPVDHQQRAVALTLQQRVGGDGGAHLDLVDEAWRDRVSGGQGPAPA